MPSACRMSSSWTQQSKTRTPMKRRYGTRPTGESVSASRSTPDSSASCSVRSATTSRKSENASSTASDRASWTNFSLSSPIGLRTYSRTDSGNSMSGTGSPASMCSVPAMCATMSRTVHPGSAVAAVQSSFFRPASTSSRRFHCCTRWRTSTGAVSLDSLSMPPRLLASRPAGGRSRG